MSVEAFKVETVYDSKKRYHRVRPLPGQGIKVMWVQFPKNLRADFTEGQVFECQLLDTGRGFYRATGLIESIPTPEAKAAYTLMGEKGEKVFTIRGEEVHVPGR